MARGKRSKVMGPATESLRDACRALPGTTEDIKWEKNLVFSVGKKMYAVFDTDGDDFSFKVSEDAFSVLTQMPGVSPAPYLARHHWIAVEGPEVLPHDEVCDLLGESHRMVAAKLSSKLRRELGLA